MQFTAEIIEVKARKIASGDKLFRIVLETDEDITSLQKHIATEVVKVVVEGASQ